MKKTFEEIFKKYWPYVRAIAFAKNELDVDDIAAKVFYRLAKTGVSNFKDDISLKAWLSKITTNICIDNMRASARDKFKKEQYAYTLKEVEETTDKDRAEIEQVVITFILEEIERLPSKMKEVFKLYYFKKLNVRQVAKELNISINTAMNQLQNARDHIRMEVLFNKKTAPFMERKLLFKPGKNSKNTGV